MNPRLMKCPGPHMYKGLTGVPHSFFSLDIQKPGRSL